MRLRCNLIRFHFSSSLTSQRGQNSGSTWRNPPRAMIGWPLILKMSCRQWLKKTLGRNHNNYSITCSRSTRPFRVNKTNLVAEKNKRI
jgi:hypothetical protein